MIPVALRLKNFMSYGSDAPVLDFEQFQVACLSGRNGQGKSALLEAITWSLWGEARKSSGGHKPDDELVRIGSREMQVEFVFDIEGERYRVVRSYRRSASGKTSRPDLELHVREASNGEYRPLTGASMRETQRHIDTVVGLDYDTFINSAFLLQGRSDEFTKKRPSERKDILSRILNLSRYELLHEMAAGYERDARKSIEQADLDTQRLIQGLETEPEWQAQHAQVNEQIARERDRLDALRAEEKRLTERLADLEARAREAETVRQALDALGARIAQHEQDARNLHDRIASAEALVAQRDAIQRDHERYLALQKERDELDTKNELYRGLEKQRERAERDLKDRKNDLERQLDKLRFELKNLRKALSECEALLIEAPVVQRQYDAAQAARREEEAMQALRQKQQGLDEELRAVERALVGEREALSGRVHTLEQQIQRDARALPDREALEAQRVQLQGSMARRDKLREELELTRVKGQAVAEDLHARSGKLAARKEELAEKQEQETYLRLEDSTTCPTCGTELTPAHRAEAATQLQAALAALQQTLAQEERQIEERNRDRTRLLEAYREVQQQIAACEGVPEQLAKVEEQIRAVQEARAALDSQEAEARQLRRQLETEAYGEIHRHRQRDLMQQRVALAFDEEAFERIRHEAAQVVRFEERLRQMEETTGRKEQVGRSIARTEAEAQALRTALDDGSALGPLQEQIRQLDERLAGVGFDAPRFHAVKQALDELSEAGARMTALVNAQQNHADWKQRLADVQGRARKEAQEREQQTAHLATLQAALAEKPALEALRQEKTAACRAVEAEMQTLQVQLGQLSEKLEKAARDRAQLKQRRSEQSEAQSKQNLFKHLKAAFGKHGIPSLIIEQTLPEIEERTNDLLGRLTDGKMRIRLETLKDKKSGGTKETLEIKITDEQGVSRAYETFSGGEAFRVNFALRIALAQLLAERSGVRIRTLVIDEGFGTQDQQGVQNLVEAIQTIQDDFDKIIVITHLPELKEAFPVRIEVEKDPVVGSRFEMIGV